MAADIFAKIGDIKGESFDDKHKDEVEVLSYSWGVTNSAHIPTGGGGSGGGAGQATFQDLSIVYKIDKASPQLLQACATGQHLKEATITFRKAGKGQQEVLIVKMNDVIITGAVQSARAARWDRRRLVWSLPRWTGSSSRKSRTDPLMRGFISSSTSKPTKSASPAFGTRGGAPRWTAHGAVRIIDA